MAGWSPSVRFRELFAVQHKAFTQIVITGLVPVIHALLRPRPAHVDGRNKSGHDSPRGSKNFGY